MRWRNTETPTFAGSDGTRITGPDVVETFELLDRDGNVVATFTKSVTGVYTLNVAGNISQNGATLAGAFYPAGSIDCSSSPNYPAANAGATYKISVAGKIGGGSGITVQVGDEAACLATSDAGTQAQVGSNWLVVQGNVVSTADVPDSTNKRYVTDAQSTVLGNTSGTNTGDNVEVAAQTVGFTITKGTTPKTLTVPLDATVSGTNTGDQDISGKLDKATVPVALVLACSDESTVIAAGTAKLTFRMPHAMTLTAVRASLGVAAATGTFTVDINEGGTSVLSTKLTIDATEKTSTTAATPAVISDASLADDAEITIDVDVDGDGAAKGLKVVLIGTRAV